MSDEIDQKLIVGQNTYFFLRFFPPAHFDHWKPTKGLTNFNTQQFRSKIEILPFYVDLPFNKNENGSILLGQTL